MSAKMMRQTDKNVVILPGAAVLGDVSFGPDCAVWFNAVLRSDGNPISIGMGTNIQDNAVLHADSHPVALGDYVTVGHGTILHGCNVGDNTVIGMGAILLDGAKVGKNCMVGAGAVVTGKTDASDGSMLLGNPARLVRALTLKEIAGLKKRAIHYAELKEAYR